MSTDKVTYTFVKDQENGNLVFRSKVNSFNLDHVTDKDISSFYRNFSNYAALDTGLLPVDGTGLLAIRSAGNHTQVAYQYKPGMYYVNWGAHERDNNAVSYYVAQPYRIVIIDFVDNNLLGARTYYSPIPATHPGIQLYHVNLPNINCRGYRGNGVGWICLYHNQDWSSLPFNERLSRALERCSGVEVYNDANMSETDGPRFYATKGKPSYIINPREWEEKSQAEGFDWTIDENLWIPIMVENRDIQDKHYEGENAVPLTLGDAIVGKYNAYYNDSYHPKPINALTNPNLSLSPSSVSTWFIKAYNDSSTSFVGVDPYLQSQAVREQQSKKILPPSQLLTSDEEPNNGDDDENSICDHCESEVSESESIHHSDQNWCQECFNENFTLCENTEEWLHDESEDLYYDPMEETHYDLSGFKSFTVCSSCEALHGVNPAEYKLYHGATENWQPNIWHTESTGEFCSVCIDKEEEHFNTEDGTAVNCSACDVLMPKFDHSIVHQIEDNYHITEEYKHICNLCASKLYNKLSCITGAPSYSYDFIRVINPKTYIISESTYPAAYNAITEEMKSHESEIHDEYLLTVDKVSSYSSLMVFGSQIDNILEDMSNKINIDFEHNNRYRLVKESALSALETSMQKDVSKIKSLISSYTLIITPNEEPF
jgi:hypothetical protein